MKEHRDTRHTAPSAGDPATPTDVWFLAYDISHPKRLRRVHRCVRREGVALQYSGFAVTGDGEHLQGLLQTLASIIDERNDDVRAYHLPTRCKVWALGRQSWPGDITLTGQGALAQLLTVADEAVVNDDLQEDTAEHGTMGNGAV